MARLVHLLGGLLVAVVSLTAQKFEGEVCEAGPNLFGLCMRVESCSSALADIRNGRKPVVCSYEKEMPIVCCANPNIVDSPTQVMHVWPTEDDRGPVMGQRPPPQSFEGQGQNQRPPFGQGQNQRPPFGQGQNQRPPFGQQPSVGQGQNQRPSIVQGQNQRPPFGQQPSVGQGQSQRPSIAQGQNQRPVGSQGANQQPFGGQRPNQRPPNVQGQNQLPFGGEGQPPANTAAPSQPPENSPSSGKPTRRPWWQIPNRKTTESPAVIDNLATLPMRAR